MKSFKNIILVTVAIIIGLVGCGSGGSDWIVGVWETEFMGMNITFKYETDGTYEKTGTGSVFGDEVSPTTENGTYSIDGDIVSFTYEDGEIEKMKISNREQNSFFGTPIGGAPFILEFKRKIN